MASTQATRHLIRELAHRANDGVEVVLLWREHTNELTVGVVDLRSGSSFSLVVDPAGALDAFYHPYSYAAFMGVPYDGAQAAARAPVAATPAAVHDDHARPTT